MPRLTIEFSENVNEILKDLAKKDQITKVDVIRRSLALFDFIHKEVVEGNKRLIVTDDNGDPPKEILLTQEFKLNDNIERLALNVSRYILKEIA